MTRFSEKRVLLTGAAGRIGAATARQFGREGARLVLADLSAEGLDALCAELAQEGIEAHAAPYDALCPQDHPALMQKAIKALGGLDILANIGGTYTKVHSHEMTDAEWARLLQVNLNSPFALCREAIPALRDSKGVVCSVSSLAALEGVAYGTAYAASKAALIAMTKSLAAEYAAAGIRFNAVVPGGVRSPMSHVPAPAGFDPELAFRRSKLAGLKDGLLEPEDIASAIAYLTAPSSRNISGATLVVDGAQNLM